jgi:hypothetical protein
MSHRSQPDSLLSGSVSPTLSSTHEAELLLKLTLNESGYRTYSALPDSTPRTIIPLDGYTLYPEKVAAYVTCCQTHATALSTPFFPEFAGTPDVPVPTHRPSVLLKSAHTRRHPQLEPPTDARRHAILWPSTRRILVFAFNEIICPCCSTHANLLKLNFRDTFAAYNDEIEEMNLETVPTVSRTSTPTYDEYEQSLARTSNSASAAFQSLHLAPPVVPHTASPMLPIAVLTTRPSDETVSTPSTQSPIVSRTISIEQTSTPTSTLPIPGRVIWSDDESSPDPLSPPNAPTSQAGILPTPAHPSYVAVTNRPSVPHVVRPSPFRRSPLSREPRPPIDAMTTPVPTYVTDPERSIYKPNFEIVATVLRSEMLLCLHILDYPHPSTNAVTAARQFVALDIQSEPNLRSTLGNYTFAIRIFAEHLQDTHLNGIQSSSADLRQALEHDPQNCEILRCIFYYREGPSVDATAYLESFNPLNTYHLLLSRLNTVRHNTTPRMKVVIDNIHPSTKCYRLPESDFEVDLRDRDPSSLSAIPPSQRPPHYSSSTSSRGSASSQRRYVTRRPQGPP